ncbi:hypothetical protein OC846_002953 [Tilletia horrida]|uniref:HTH APSES-type domain-containing protein n=1 Tax=Tilletia horrida TaxID=155126 RepID=A0AAN6JS61_9BASI|nr:hypothetical protein OC846_002953 [Tilletia horrida]KAK0566823.1 hypothetical protein OC861_003019 [Tilletia horrida]
MPAPRRSTPRRGRSSSVLSNEDASAGNTTSNASPSSAAVHRVAKPLLPADHVARHKRPDLPKGTNSVLPDGDVPVKLQIIEREGKDIIIGRVKLPLPSGGSATPAVSDHAFLLKRFDTNALAASSMFKIAFPYADPAAEEAEMQYLERRYDCDGANGGNLTPGGADDDGHTDTPTKRPRGRPRKSAAPATSNSANTGVRLQGTWIPASDALEVAEEYRILRYARGLIEARAELDENRQLYLILPNGNRIHQAASKRAAAKSNGASASTTENNATETPKRKRARQSEATTTTTTTTTSSSGAGTPSVIRTKTTRTVGQDGTEEVRVERTETTVGAVISSEDANAQLEQARALAISKRVEAAAAGASGAGSASRKRRAVADAPRSDEGEAGEEDEYEGDGTVVPSNALVTSVRRGATAVRRRPLVSAAGFAGATAVAGAGALAYASGYDLQAAIQMAQQGLAQIGLPNLSGIFQF